jgi:hypothetical protein
MREQATKTEHRFFFKCTYDTILLIYFLFIYSFVHLPKLLFKSTGVLCIFILIFILMIHTTISKSKIKSLINLHLQICFSIVILWRISQIFLFFFSFYYVVARYSRRFFFFAVTYKRMTHFSLTFVCHDVGVREEVNKRCLTHMNDSFYQFMKSIKRSTGLRHFLIQLKKPRR